jgi:tetratricopeptide (TPR) repeat protein
LSFQRRPPRLDEFYERYLEEEDTAQFIKNVSGSYLPATLARIAELGGRMSRRAAVLALGFLGDFQVNRVLGNCLADSDRGVRMMAENAIRAVWCRDGNSEHQSLLQEVIQLNTQQQYDDALHKVNQLLAEASWFAEAYNQRAVALFCGKRYAESIEDCRQTLELNPYHFGAAAGMGQCYLQLGNKVAALESFRRALKLNSNLEGVRAQVVYLQRLLKNR